MSLIGKINLCYINRKDLEQWIKENNLLNQDFTIEKERWKREINQKTNFFSDTELLIVYQDILVLKVFSDNQANFFAKTYQLEYQNICQKLFQDTKNIILVSERQLKMTNESKEQANQEKLIVLLKNRESIEKSLSEWLKGEGDG
ncbi:MAG: hypothetical protein I3273_06375 [Candidatus Moeniiplasma glomeromycotorum]|nr:hypothetical protein [Candidatus Moeniiplasma glomeromycotorum]MCE8168174.1 hypothetical protein [Candidatus Moeniiplasma glomeromycotorum]MCE8169710.1 hypothetical protein [Candidatus Moeniiplasma glomeromycotorum]